MPHMLASDAGLEVLRRGGHAVDAAIAAAVTIAVVYPHMNGVGGDNVWLIYDGRQRRLLGLNAAGRSAAAADAVDRGLGPHEAVEAPRWLYGRTWGEPSTKLRLEGRFEAGGAESLARRGHEARVVDAWSDLMGHAQVIEIGDRELRGGSDPRADGAALGW